MEHNIKSEYGGLIRTVKFNDLTFRIYDDDGWLREQKRKQKEKEDWNSQELID